MEYADDDNAYRGSGDLRDRPLTKPAKSLWYVAARRRVEEADQCSERKQRKVGRANMLRAKADWRQTRASMTKSVTRGRTTKPYRLPQRCRRESEKEVAIASRGAAGCRTARKRYPQSWPPPYGRPAVKIRRRGRHRQRPSFRRQSAEPEHDRDEGHDRPSL